MPCHLTSLFGGTKWTSQITLRKDLLFSWFLPYPGKSFKAALPAGRIPGNKALWTRPATMRRAQATWRYGLRSNSGSTNCPKQPNANKADAPNPSCASRKALSQLQPAQDCLKLSIRRSNPSSKSHVFLLIYSSCFLCHSQTTSKPYLSVKFPALEASCCSESRRPNPMGEHFLMDMGCFLKHTMCYGIGRSEISNILSLAAH